MFDHTMKKIQDNFATLKKLLGPDLYIQTYSNTITLSTMALMDDDIVELQRIQKHLDNEVKRALEVIEETLGK